jgi:hypothetical protein
MDTPLEQLFFTDERVGVPPLISSNSEFPIGPDSVRSESSLGSPMGRHVLLAAPPLPPQAPPPSTPLDDQYSSMNLPPYQTQERIEGQGRSNSPCSRLSRWWYGDGKP